MNNAEEKEILLFVSFSTPTWHVTQKDKLSERMKKLDGSNPHENHTLEVYKSIWKFDIIQLLQYDILEVLSF